MMDIPQNGTFDFTWNPSNFTAHDYMPVLQEYRYQDRWFNKPTEVVISVAYCTVILLGLLGNGIVCLIVLRTDKLRTAKNMFIVNLSISDIMMCLISMPFTLLKLIMKNWPLGKIMCKIIPFVHMTDVFVSTATIMAIAFDRHRYIVYARKKTTSNRTVWYSIAIIWAVSVSLSLPVFIFSKVKPVEMVHEMVRYEICMEDWSSGKFRIAYTTLLVLVQYLLPVIVISCLHVKICHFLRLRITENPLSPQQFERSMRAIQRHRKNTALLTSIALTFGITWLPLTVLNIVADYNYRIFLDGNFNLGYAICHLTAMLSASANPIIYGWLNPNFRDEFLSLVICFRKRSKDTTESTEDERADFPMRRVRSSSPKSSSSANYRSTVFH